MYRTIGPEALEFSSCSVLREAGGETPPAYSPVARPERQIATPDSLINTRRRLVTIFRAVIRDRLV
jgi:hypothetical protein